MAAAPSPAPRTRPCASEPTLQTSGGQKIILNSDGIKIDNGKGGTITIDNASKATIALSSSMKLTNAASTVELSPASVSVNNGALEVT